MKLDPKTTAFVFPGQGSQTVGMGKELVEQYDAAKQTFDEADSVLGFPFSAIMWEGPVADLNDTVNTQPALYIHSIAAFRTVSHLFPDFKPATAGRTFTWRIICSRGIWYIFLRRWPPPGEETWRTDEARG